MLHSIWHADEREVDPPVFKYPDVMISSARFDILGGLHQPRVAPCKPGKPAQRASR